ncbi:hypothetical protein HPB47_012654 [Ixodes persulcatus]|uniref:Uncharacterized protein n=1 Tax=Ixodes persulcatus TaxID=34615 RepID=A0AC60NSV6_IXOPE|nr:hypothetical protein HPB47_012654 [Ixodes persulcatus]
MIVRGSDTNEDGFVVSSASETSCLRLLEMKVPSAVIQGRSMWLNCTYDLESDELYSVKWYKNDTEFYRYIPRDRPPAQNYDLPGVVVDMVKSREGNVFVAAVNLSTEGNYRCEASAEAPSFQTVVGEREVKVFGGFDLTIRGDRWRTAHTSSEHVERKLALQNPEILGSIPTPARFDLEVRAKLHWVPFDVSNDTLRKALEEYGTVHEVTKEKWRVEGFEDIESTTRIAKLTLKEGKTPENLPHQLRLQGGTILVVVPGRAPLCLRCRRQGHIRRDCRVPRCGHCRGFGHVAQDCARTYASAVVSRASDEGCDFIMDEAEAEEAATLSTPFDRTQQNKTTVEGHDNRAEATVQDEKPTETAPEANEKEGKTTTSEKPSSEAVAVMVMGSTGTEAAAIECEPAMELDPSKVKRRLDDESPKNVAPVQQWSEGEFQLIGKKGRYVRKLRSSSLTRDGGLSQ